MKNHIENFKTYLENLGYQNGTIKAACRAVNEFLELSQEPNLENLNTAHINAFYEHLQTRPHKNGKAPLSESYICSQFIGVRNFFEWLLKTQQIDIDPSTHIHTNRKKKVTRQPLTQDQIHQLFNATQTIKEKVILHLCYSCGLRRGEAVRLQLKDIDFTNNLLYIREGKGVKRRVIPLTTPIKKDLATYCKKYHPTNTNQALFIGRKGEQLHTSAFMNQFKRILYRTPLQTTITLHYLRHSIATHLLENGMSIHHVREFLGHSHLESTQLYAKVNQHLLNTL